MTADKEANSTPIANMAMSLGKPTEAAVRIYLFVTCLKATPCPTPARQLSVHLFVAA